MGSHALNSLRQMEKYSGLSDEEIARKYVEDNPPYRFGIRYTNKFAQGDEPTDIGFGFLPEEYDQYMSLKNAKLLYRK